MKKVFLGIILVLLISFSCGCKKSTVSIVGKWKSTDENNEYYYIFNDDKTCSYEMKVARLGCTYENDKNKITILYDGTEQAKTYEYRFEKKDLIIIDDNGNDNRFIKQK